MFHRGLIGPVLASIAVACGGGTEGPGSPACTGEVPAEAMACPGADEGLEVDSPRVLVASCAAAAPCAYVCRQGFLLAEAACVAAGACTGDVPGHATLCPDADQGLTADAPRVVRATCDAPCAYTCDAGFDMLGNACVPEGSPDDVVVRDNGDGTVTVVDSNASLLWLKDANCLEAVGGVSRPVGGVPYADALSWVGALASGACGLADGSSAGDWRLPDDSELQLLARDLDVVGEEAWSTFEHIQVHAYWSTFSTCTGIYGVVEISTGLYSDVAWDEPFNVWPMRDSR